MNVPALDEIGSLTLTATIYTSAAGFSATPLYTARLMGSRLLPDDSNRPVLTDALINLITTPALGPRQFTLQIFPFSQGNVTVAQIKSEWQVGWMGIES
jgi:hypothetical protein